jgi:hypothetical protein
VFVTDVPWSECHSAADCKEKDVMYSADYVSHREAVAVTETAAVRTAEAVSASELQSA